MAPVDSRRGPHDARIGPARAGGARADPACGRTHAAFRVRHVERSLDELARGTADEIIEIDEAAGRFVERAADHRVRARWIQPYTEDARSRWSFDDGRSGLESSKARRRTSIPNPILLEAKSLAELYDELEQAIGQVSLPDIRDRDLEMPDRFDECGQMRRTTFGEAPTTQPIVSPAQDGIH